MFYTMLLHLRVHCEHVLKRTMLSVAAAEWFYSFTIKGVEVLIFSVGNSIGLDSADLSCAKLE